MVVGPFAVVGLFSIAVLAVILSVVLYILVRAFPQVSMVLPVNLQNPVTVVLVAIGLAFVIAVFQPDILLVIANELLV